MRTQGPNEEAAGGSWVLGPGSWVLEQEQLSLQFEARTWPTHTHTHRQTNTHTVCINNARV